MQRRPSWRDAAPNGRDTAKANPLRSSVSTGQLHHEKRHSSGVPSGPLSLVRGAGIDTRPPPYIRCVYSRDATPMGAGPPAGRHLRHMRSMMANTGRPDGASSRIAAGQRLADARTLFHEYDVSPPAG